MTAALQDTALKMIGITKAFPGIIALNAVDFDCQPGEIHAICGENGAGKSTLMKVLGGNYRADAGEIRIGNSPVHFTHPAEAARAGISIVHQELSLLPFRTVAQNIFMGHEITRAGFVDRKAMAERSQALLDRISASIHPDQLVSELSIADQQLVEIAKALLLDARILVMDEPTAALDERAAQDLLRLVGELKRQGIAIVYISHRMAEVSAIADRVTVIKDGQRVWTRTRGEFGIDDIVSAMVGRDLKDFYPAIPVQEPGHSLIRVESGANAQLKRIDLELFKGEILGVAGLEDSGKAMLAQALVGDVPFSSGLLYWKGRVAVFKSSRQATKAGIGYLPGDRKREGLALKQSVRDNAALTLRAMAAIFARPETGKASRVQMDAALEAADVRAADYGQDIIFLSGGNQQKAIIARWLAQECEVLVFVEPTRGIDIAAKAAIYQTMRDFADSGRGIIVVSSDLPELIGVSDRILVMHQGAVSATLGWGASEQEIIRMSLGLNTTPEAAA